MGEVLSAQRKEMSEIKSNLAAPSQMAAMMEEVKKRGKGIYPMEIVWLFLLSVQYRR
jgi:hypothetical protein